MSPRRIASRSCVFAVSGGMLPQVITVILLSSAGIVLASHQYDTPAVEVTKQHHAGSAHVQAVPAGQASSVALNYGHIESQDSHGAAAGHPAPIAVHHVKEIPAAPALALHHAAANVHGPALALHRGPALLQSAQVHPQQHTALLHGPAVQLQPAPAAYHGGHVPVGQQHLVHPVQHGGPAFLHQAAVHQVAPVGLHYAPAAAYHGGPVAVQHDVPVGVHQGGPVAFHHAAPVLQRVASVPVHAAPGGVVKAVHQEPVYPPHPYSFGYEIQDEHGNRQSRHEVSDAHNNKKGMYSFRDVHGIYRQVEYVADAHGFRATVHTNEPGTAAGHTAGAFYNAQPVHVKGVAVKHAAPIPAAFAKVHAPGVVHNQVVAQAPVVAHGPVVPHGPLLQHHGLQPVYSEGSAQHGVQYVEKHHKVPVVDQGPLVKAEKPVLFAGHGPSHKYY